MNNLKNLNPNKNIFNGTWNTENVQVTIPSGQRPSRINFPDIQNLRNVRLSRLKTYSLNEVPASMGGILTVPQNVMFLSFITLQMYDGTQKIHQMPMCDIYAFLGNPVNLPNFVGQIVDWPKSYIEIEWGATIAFPQDTNFVFNVEYFQNDKLEETQLGTGFKEMN